MTDLPKTDPPGLNVSAEWAVNDLKDALTAQNVALSDVHEAKIELARRRASILQAHADNPKELGGNEAAREASLDFLTITERNTLTDAEVRLRAAQTRTECARLDWDRVRLQVRLLDIATRGDDHA